MSTPSRSFQITFLKEGKPTSVAVNGGSVTVQNDFVLIVDGNGNAIAAFPAGLTVSVIPGN